jgi:hypothetical protein
MNMSKIAIMGQCPKCGGNSDIEEDYGMHETKQLRIRICFNCRFKFFEDYKECLIKQFFYDDKGNMITIYPSQGKSIL